MCPLGNADHARIRSVVVSLVFRDTSDTARSRARDSFSDSPHTTPGRSRNPARVCGGPDRRSASGSSALRLHELFEALRVPAARTNRGPGFPLKSLLRLVPQPERPPVQPASRDTVTNQFLPIDLLDAALQ